MIAAVGRLWPQKRLKDVIWATDLLRVIRDDVYLLVIGDGPQRAALQRYALLCRVDDRVRFLGVRSDVLQLLPHCELLWLASGYEGLPNAVLEAMAAGIPVVATDVPGTRQLVVHGETGFLLPVGDARIWPAMPSACWTIPNWHDGWEPQDANGCCADYSVAAMVERFAGLYRELLAGRPVTIGK